MRRKSPEQDFQISLVRDLRKILPSDALVIAFPAGGGGLVRGRFLKAAGLLAGFPDLLILHRGEAFCMELKAAKGKLSEAQLTMHETLSRCRIPVGIVRTLDEALSFLKSWEFETRIAA